MGLLTTETVSMAAAPPLSARVRRFSGLRVCRRWGLRLRGADRWSRLPTERFGGLWERVLAGRTAVAREGRMLTRGRLQAEAEIQGGHQKDNANWGIFSAAPA